MTLVLWLLGLYLAKIVIAKCLGDTILGTRDERMSSVASALLIGLVIVIVAVNLPYIGSVLNFLLILIGFGACVMAAYHVYQMSGLRRNADNASDH